MLLQVWEVKRHDDTTMPSAIDRRARHRGVRSITAVKKSVQTIRLQTSDSFNSAQTSSLVLRWPLHSTICHWKVCTVVVTCRLYNKPNMLLGKSREVFRRGEWRWGCGERSGRREINRKEDNIIRNDLEKRHVNQTANLAKEYDSTVCNQSHVWIRLQKRVCYLID